MIQIDRVTNVSFADIASMPVKGPAIRMTDVTLRTRTLLSNPRSVAQSLLIRVNQEPAERRLTMCHSAPSIARDRRFRASLTNPRPLRAVDKVWAAAMDPAKKAKPSIAAKIMGNETWVIPSIAAGSESWGDARISTMHPTNTGSPIGTISHRHRNATVTPINIG